MRKLLVLPLLLAATSLGLGGAASAADEEPAPTDTEKDCEELIPHVASPLLTATPDDGSAVDLTVAVLADGVSTARAAEVLEAAAVSYAALDITLTASSITSFDLGSGETVDATGSIQAAKDHFGGARPAGADLVYVITDKDLVDPGLGSAVAGLADCIGGVETPQTAFAVGEDAQGTETALGPITLYAHSGVKVMAHELGHLMGAHHHYQSCVVEGITTDDLEGDFGPCTLMSNFVDFQGRNFSTLEGAVVRGHAWDFAR